MTCFCSFWNPTPRSERLKIHYFPATNATGEHPPLFFVHGGFSHSLYWTIYFIPFFQQQGYECYALDLSGHGDSSGREFLDRFGVDDFVDDLAYAVNTIGKETVIISHSMGSLITQRLLGRGVKTVKGAVFIAPIPASGTGASAVRLAFNSPDFFTELEHLIQGRTLSDRALDIMARTYFSPHTDRTDILKTLPMIQPESVRAVTEMVSLPLPLFEQRPAIPVLFLAGTEDAVFPSIIMSFNAMNWKQSKVVEIKGAGHMVMLDVQWQEAATAIQDWLDTAGF